MTDADYCNAYIKSIEHPKVGQPNLYTIGFIGLNGSGKSTVARLLSERLNLFIASNDAIRRWLNTQGFPGESPEQALMQKIAEATSHYLFEQKISHIIDNDLMHFHDKARANAAHFGADLHLIHVYAPEAIVLERLRTRQAMIMTDTQEHSHVGVEEYRKRKVMHAAHVMPPVAASIDTSKELTSQIDTFLRTLQDYYTHL